MLNLQPTSINLTREICVPELAKFLGCTIPKAQALIRVGRIPGHKNARGWVTTSAAINKYLAERSTSASSRQF